MITCNDERLNKKMEELYEEYRLVAEERQKCNKIYIRRKKIEIPLWILTYICGAIGFMGVLNNPYLYILGCLGCTVNTFKNQHLKNKLDLYEEELNVIKEKITDVEYEMHNMRRRDEEIKERAEALVKKIREREKIENLTKNLYSHNSDENDNYFEDIVDKTQDGLKLSKYHDFRYTEEEARRYKNQYDITHELDRYGIYYNPFDEKFSSDLTGDYENPVFVVMNNKGKILKKIPKYNNNNG